MRTVSCTSRIIFLTRSSSATHRALHIATERTEAARSVACHTERAARYARDRQVQRRIHAQAATFACAPRVPVHAPRRLASVGSTIFRDFLVMADSDDEEGKQCLNCGASFEGLRRCGKCKAAYFCNAACQREVWKEHCKTCVAPAGAAPPPPPDAPCQAAASGAPAASGVPPAAAEPKYTPEQIKLEGLRRVKQEVLPEVGALMREGKFADAIEHLEESVAFASGADERELLDVLSCLTARCYLGMGKPKEALQGLNPALMQARREGGPSAIKPHSIAAECFRALGDAEKTRVELRALVEAAAESTDEAEQAGALLLAGIALFDMGDLHASVPLLASAAAAAEKVGDFAGRAAARGRAGAALLRLRRPSQAVEAWTDELKALEEGERREKESKEQKETGDSEDGAGCAESANERSSARVEKTRGAGAGGPNEAKEAKKETSAQKTKPEARALAPVGDARARRCRAHGNLFTAHLLIGARQAAETHLAHACSIARTLGAKEEAETWLRAGHARRLAGDASDGVPADAREAYDTAAAVARGAGLDELAARAMNGAEGNTRATEMIDGG